ncbi:MAG: hypothetical protein R3C14_02960 [Caldilineaceae bacterium]
MFKQLAKFMSIVLLAGSLTMAISPTAFAAERPGYSAASAAMPTPGVKVLQTGQWDWYVFHAQIPLNETKDSQGHISGSTVDATMHVTSGQGSFEIWTPNMVNKWKLNESFNPVGEGTQLYTVNPINPTYKHGESSNSDESEKNADTNNALKDYATSTYTWQGNFQEPGTFYLIVKNNGSQPLDYTLSITGNSVVFPSQLSVQ